jgi:hypothetical protein
MMGSLMGVQVQAHEAEVAAGKKPLSFRSLRAAMDAAHDGDRIIMLRGIHNFAGTLY